MILVRHTVPPTPRSPNRELIERWRRAEFDLLYSADTLGEYAEKLLTLGVAWADAVAFLALVIALGEEVEIGFFHLPRYPHDADDIAFLLCGLERLGMAHLVHLDEDLLELAESYRSQFFICRPFDSWLHFAQSHDGTG